MIIYALLLSAPRVGYYGVLYSVTVVTDIVASAVYNVDIDWRNLS